VKSKSKKSTPMLGRNGFKYHQQYGVIVVCESERRQEQIYNQLRARGLKCKVVTV
jgi:hypothetical protein